MLKVDLITDGSWPKGERCVLCPRTAQIGDFVAYQKRRFGSNPPFTILFHKECLEEQLEAMPFDSSPRAEDINNQILSALGTLKENRNDRVNA